MSAISLHENTALASARHAAAQGGTPLVPREWLTFRLGEEAYGMDILRVQEIRSYEKPTRIANMPDCIKGVVNLRGVIVPILDLRMKLGMSELRHDSATVIIVLNVGTQVVGAVVDSVSDVVELKPNEVKPCPAMPCMGDAGFFTGIASLQQDGAARLLILLDIASLVASMKVDALAPEEAATA